MNIKEAFASNGAAGKLRLSVVLEGTAAAIVRQALEEVGVTKGGYRAFVRDALLTEIQKRAAQQAATQQKVKPEKVEAR